MKGDFKKKRRTLGGENRFRGKGVPCACSIIGAMRNNFQENNRKSVMFNFFNTASTRIVYLLASLRLAVCMNLQSSYR